MPLEFREAREHWELVALKELRSRSYRTSAFSSLLEDPATFARHDCASHHYGLFDGSSGDAYGYLRVTPYQEGVDPPLPCLAYAVPKLARDIGGLARHTQVVEANRLSVLPGHRAKGFARGMAEAAVAIHRIAAGQLSVVTCKTTHVGFYRRLGYDVMFRSGQLRVGGTEVVALVGPFHTVDDPRYKRLTAMARAYQIERRVSLDQFGFVLQPSQIDESRGSHAMGSMSVAS